MMRFSDHCGPVPCNVQLEDNALVGVRSPQRSALGKVKAGALSPLLVHRSRRLRNPDWLKQGKTRWGKHATQAQYLPCHCVTEWARLKCRYSEAASLSGAPEPRLESTNGMDFC